jgi:hypothetical protein
MNDQETPANGMDQRQTQGSQNGGAEHDTAGDTNEVIDRLLEGRNHVAEEYELDTPEGTIVLKLAPIEDRKQRYDYLSKLPDAWFDAAEEGDGEDEIKEKISNADAIPSGEGWEALENMVRESETSVADMNLNWVIDMMEDDVLMEAGVTVLDLSMDLGQIGGFRRRQ